MIPNIISLEQSYRKWSRNPG